MSEDLSAFAESYAEARAKFLDAARASGASLRHYRQADASGPAGEALYLDVAWLGAPQASRVLLAGCGTHGIEGFAGSAAQTHWMRSGGAARIAAATAVVFFHAHNPWGFAHKTRTTEENVDLNRNFVDFSRPLRANPGYEELHPLITPPRWDEAAVAATFRALDEFRARVGEQSFSDAFNGGQYSHPDGIYFGGSRPQWANRAFRQAVAEHLSAVRQVALIDLHTGIGPRYEHVYLCFHAAGSAGYARARAWWGERAVNRAAVTHKALAVYSGTLIDAFAAMVPQAEITAVVIEFGTLPREGIQRAALAQRWLRFHGSREPERAREVQREYEHAYYPAEARWRACVLEQSLEFFDCGLKGIGAAWN